MASSWWSVWGIFWQPGAVFARLKERPVWFPAYATMVVVGVAAFLLWSDPVIETLSAFSAEQARQAGVEAELPPFMGTLFTVTLLGGTVATPLLTSLLLAVLGLLAGLAVGGGLRFSLWYSLVMWALVPAFTVGAVVQTFLLAQGAVGATGQAGLTLAPLVAAESALYPVLKAVDLFSIWTAVLVAAGFGVLTGAGRSRAILTGAVFFLVPALVKAFLAARAATALL